MNEKLLELGRRRAEEVLLGNVDETLGLLGGRQAYQQVWAREAAICSLGLAFCTGGTAAARRSLETLRTLQSPLGNIPHNVGFPSTTDVALRAMGTAETVQDRVATMAPDTAHAGCIDSSLWYIIAHWYLWRLRPDLSSLHSAWPSLKRALLWLQYQDSNECGLLEAHEAMDWADLFAHRYNTLNANVLYATVLRGMAELAEALGDDGGPFRDAAEDVKRKLNVLLWVGPREGDGRQRELEWAMAHRKEWLYPMRLMDVALAERPYYLPYVAFRDYGERCDALGNLLAIVFDVALPDRADETMHYLWSAGLDRPFPMRAVHPPIQPGEKEWRDYYRATSTSRTNTTTVESGPSSAGFTSWRWASWAGGARLSDSY